MKTKLTMFVLSMLVSQASLRGQGSALPAGSVVAGLTLEEWTVEWWKWFTVVPCSIHPIIRDTNGVFAQVGQSGPVFFLGGSYSYGGTTNYVTRTVTITADKYLFFPVLNFAYDNVGRDVPLSPQELRDEVVIAASSVIEVRAWVDGVDISTHGVLRLLSPVFSYALPDQDNLYQCFGIEIPGGVYEPTAADGYWVMLAPLSAGEHLVRFRGISGDPDNFGLDLTYLLTVRRPTLSEEVGNLVSSIQRAGLLPDQERPLLAFLKASQVSFERDQLRAGLRQLSAFRRKVRARLGRDNPPLVEELVRAARAIMDRAREDLRKGGRKDDDGRDSPQEEGSK